MKDGELQELLHSLRRNGISDPRVLDAIAHTPREAFLSDAGLKARAYADEALPIECEQSMVGDGDAMRITAEVTQNLFRAAKRWFDVDDPLMSV